MFTLVVMIVFSKEPHSSTIVAFWQDLLA